MTEALPFPLGALVDGRYRVLAVIGQGGMGAVYRAEQLSLQREVALKVLRTDAGGEDASARFSREALALSKLDHPNVVRVIDSGQFEGRQYLVMELVSGRDLLQELAPGPMSPERAVPILAALCDALAAAHAQGIIHRDLKPENVILTEQGIPKILDFGIAIADGGVRITGIGLVLGTPEYVAPEQAMGQPLTPRSDLYTLGVVAYRMLAGKLPFTATDAREYMVHHAGTAPPELREAWSEGKNWPELCDAIMKALQKDPWARFSDALAMKRALEDGLARRTPAPPENARGVGEIVPERAASFDSRKTCVIFCELWNRTPRLTPLSAEEAARRKERFEAELGKVVRSCGGRRMKSPGDAWVIAIPSATEALALAMAAHDQLWRATQAAMATGTKVAAIEPLSAHLSIALGEVTTQDGELLGEPVDIAARVLGLAGEGEIVLTDAVQLAMQQGTVAIAPLGAQELTGIAHPVRCFKALPRGVAGGPPFGTQLEGANASLRGLGARIGELGRALQNRARSDRRVVPAAIGVVALGVIGIALLWSRPGLSPPISDAAPLYDAAERALAARHPKEAQQILAPLLASGAPSARALALEGRTRIALGEWVRGLDGLHEAVDRDASLRPELVNACVQALGQSGRKKCPVREKAIFLLTALRATEARPELTRIVAASECAHQEAAQALAAIPAPPTTSGSTGAH